MNIQLFVLFVALTIVNVVLQTVRSLCTVSDNKLLAASANALCYGLYVVIIVYTMCDLPLWLKVLTTALCNFIGVYIVKVIEQKLRKDKMWEVRATVNCSTDKGIEDLLAIRESLHNFGIGYYDWVAGKYKIFNIYCPTQQESQTVKEILSSYSNVKYFVSENKSL